VPAWSAAVVAVVMAVAGSGAVATLTFALLAFVTAATVAELTRGVRAQRRASEGSWVAAVGAAVRRNRRLYGGLVAHLGLLVAIAGISWAAVGDRSGELSLAVGERAAVEGYTVRLDGIQTREEPQRRVIVARVTVFDRDGAEVVELHPSLNLYPASSEPIGTPSIRAGTPWNGMRDLYVSLVAVDGPARTAAFRVFVNPGIGLLWLGGLVTAAGGVVAAWPSRPRRSATPLPEPAEPRVEVPV
jgi:cytochrome c-type biogenesis protein CcmF